MEGAAALFQDERTAGATLWRVLAHSCDNRLSLAATKSRGRGRSRELIPTGTDGFDRNGTDHKTAFFWIHREAKARTMYPLKRRHHSPDTSPPARQSAHDA